MAIQLTILAKPFSVLLMEDNEKTAIEKEDEYYFGGLTRIDLTELEAVASSEPIFIDKGSPF